MCFIKEMLPYSESVMFIAIWNWKMFLCLLERDKQKSKWVTCFQKPRSWALKVTGLSAWCLWVIVMPRGSTWDQDNTEIGAASNYSKEIKQNIYRKISFILLLVVLTDVVPPVQRANDLPWNSSQVGDWTQVLIPNQMLKAQNQPASRIPSEVGAVG